MENLGKTITEYRKKLSLTQKDLGEMLNVSPQAVSKWENGQAEPDASTIKRLGEIFKISTDELLGNTPPFDEVAAAQTEAAPLPEVEQPEVEPETVTPPAPETEIKVNAVQTSAQPTAKQAATRSYGYYEHKRTTILSLIVGAVAGVAMFCLVLFPMVYAGEAPFWFAAPFAAVFGIGYFAFIMQMFWGGTVHEMFFFFLKSFTMPGVIFTLDLDGLIFLLLVKVGGAILSVLLSVLFFLLGLIIMPIAAIMILPFATIARVIQSKKL